MNFIMQNGGPISDLLFLERLMLKFDDEKAVFYEKKRHSLKIMSLLKCQDIFLTVFNLLSDF